MVYLRYGIPHGLLNLLRNWRQALNSILIIAASLAVLGLVALLYQNVIGVARVWLSNTTVSLFLQPELGQVARRELLQRVQRHPMVKSVRLVAPEEGLRELAERMGQSDSLFAGIRPETLPYTVDFEVYVDYRQRIDSIVGQFAGLPGVEEAVYAERILGKVELFFRLTQGVGLFFVGLLLVAFCLVVANAIRLSLYARREEIEILDLVGASPRFIRSAYIVEGVLIATAGGAVAVGLVWFAYRLLVAGLTWNSFTASIRELAAFYPPDFLAGAVAVIMVLGGVASRIAVNRMLREMEP